MAYIHNKFSTVRLARDNDIGLHQELLIRFIEQVILSILRRYGILVLLFRTLPRKHKAFR